MLRRYILSPQIFLWFTFLSYLLIWWFQQFDTPGIRDDVLVIGVFVFIGSSVLLARQPAPVDLTARDVAKMFIGCSMALLLLVAYAIAVVGFSLTSLSDARFAVPAYGAVFALYFTSCLIGFALVGRRQGGLAKYVFVGAAAFSGLIFGGKGFVVPWVWGLIFGGQLFGVKMKASTIVALGLLSASGIFIVAASTSDGMGQMLATIGLRLFLQADALNWLSQMSYGDIASFPVSAGHFFTDIFSRLVGIRFVDRAIGSEIAYLVIGDDSGGGPNPYLPVLAYLLAHGSLAYALWLAAAVLLTLRALFVFCNASTFRRGTVALAMRAVSFTVPFAIIDLVLLFQYIFCIAAITIVGEAAGYLLLIRRNPVPAEGLPAPA